MPDYAAIARIREYLEQNRNAYEREALREQLLRDGYDPLDVAAAEASVYESATPGAPGAGSGAGVDWAFVLPLVGAIAFNLVVPTLLVYALAVTVDNPFWIFVVLLVFPIELAIAIAIRLQRKNVGRALIIGFGVSMLPFLAIALLAGACFGCIALVS